MVIGIAEFLEKVGKLSKKQEKIDALKTNDSPQMRVILQGAYDPSVVWDLPEGDPPYTPNKLVDQETFLINELQYKNGAKFHYYIKGFYDHMDKKKKENMFIELLEKVSPKDAILLCAIKDKKPIKGITLEHVMEAYPGMIQGKEILNGQDKV